MSDVDKNLLTSLRTRAIDWWRSRPYQVIAVVLLFSFLAFATLFATTGGAFLSLILKYVVGRLRPTVVPHLREVTTPSFPSGHAMLSAVVFLTIGVMLMRSVRSRRAKSYILLWSMFLAFVVGVSRVYLGVHYPTDVLGGWLAGIAWAVACGTLIHFMPLREEKHMDKCE